MTVMGSPVRICPVCNNLGTIEKKWTRKKSGKRYDYEVFHHGGVAHWVRADTGPSGVTGKDDTRSKLTKLLNSYRFRRAIFTSNDIAREFEKERTAEEYKRVRRDLMKLAESRLLSIVRKDSKVFFINDSNQERLDYIIKRVNITLEDNTDEGTFERHNYRILVLNDSEVPLHYIQFRPAGDNKRDRNKLGFSSYDMTRKEETVIHFLEDDPQLKRILIELREPIQSDKERAPSFEYFWPEIRPAYTFSAPTPTDFVQFSLVSRNDFPYGKSRKVLASSSRCLRETRFLCYDCQ